MFEEPRRLGATPCKGKTRIAVWAPKCHRLELQVVHPVEQRLELERGPNDYFTGSFEAGAGARYFLRPNGGPARPDPASRYQPDGVHGPSEVVDPSFEWSDSSWRGIPLADYIIYELHIGTFTSNGTFEAAIERLDNLVDLGVTAIEIMPVAQFPGSRNWGYDGVQPFAVQNSYGGPDGLKKLVDACHSRGLAAILDVVYNHVGPEGNYLGEYAPYFTEKYKTPWGPAVNVDGEYSDGVRRFFIDNALEWITDYHFDALRLDAVHGILDTSARPFLAELSEAVHRRAGELEREVVLIAESDLNDVRMITPVRNGGMGMDSQWMDDFHHSAHALLTGERSGYYADYGEAEHLATALRRGFVYAGEYSGYRKRRHGNSPAGTRPEQFVVCVQNHDQVGNRMLGDRLSTLVDERKLALAAACLLFSPYIPLLFMGEEYGETRPFPYFIDHSDEQLIEAVRNGRKAEFAAFSWKADPPDPQSLETFESARIEPRASALLETYTQLLALRKRHGLGPAAREREVISLERTRAIAISRLTSFALLNFEEERTPAEIPLPRGSWTTAFVTAEPDALPQHISSPGSVWLELPPISAALFVTSDN